MNKQLPKLNAKLRELTGATASKIQFEQTQCSIELTFRMEEEPEQGWLAGMIDKITSLLYFDRDWMVVDEQFYVRKELKLKLRARIPFNPAVIRVFIFPDDEIPDATFVAQCVGGHPDLNTGRPFYIRYVEFEAKDLTEYWQIMFQTRDYAHVVTASAPEGADIYASIVLD
ncbi:hypothetical protein KC571_02040 [candidate division WWE3 bacterium]|uniref:Uncharacterized protein n=1 Tax=candidate division WWE3 bacterium TaxID=2053526 RepID=A0A955RPF0_UNCKA|nr:hypothetical protein [candidate division WWE3 bacterium]